MVFRDPVSGTTPLVQMYWEQADVFGTFFLKTFNSADEDFQKRVGQELKIPENLSLSS
jgi:hypothetical protein